VTIVERDRFPSGPTFRKGVPQARHLHSLLVRGRLTLDRLFPGLGAELAAAGAVSLEWPADLMWLSPAGWGVRFRSGLTTYSCSRELLEWSIHRRVAATPNVRFEEASDVTGLLPNAGNRGVAGVELRRRDGPRGAGTGRETLAADLVVDASGRDSRAPRWLEALGYPRPRETTVNSFLGYASRYYARPSGCRPDWKGVVVQRRPPRGTRGGVVFPLEGDRWIVTLAGAARDYPPIDEADFLEFARSLPSPIVYDSIKDAVALSPVWGYRRTENRLRHYDRLVRRPERFLVIGDAVCAFNPVYGQGMAVCAEGARVLDRCLRAQPRPAGDLTGLARRFQRELARSNAAPWLMATGEDFRYPTTEGGRPGPAIRLVHRYLDRVLAVAAGDREVQRAFLEVMHLLRPPATLFRPDTAIRVLAGRRTRARSRPSAAEPGDGPGG
jgi:2-polyprenyl-6-methoxyphenol hydroxylase-like FAD-dependent oxidoreductase